MTGSATDEGAGPGLVVKGAMLSHVGAVRSLNEDTVAYVLPGAADPRASQGALLLVADGIGGHAAGEVASALAAETICCDYYRGDGAVPDLLRRCFAAANQAIHRRSLDAPECAGMGTTCTAIAVVGACVFLAHVGDSRAYLLRGETLSQLSQDHTLVAELVRQGSLTVEEAAGSPERHVILKALGTHPEVEPCIWTEGMPLQAGDRLVLCSDGLSDLVGDAEIAAASRNLPPFEACEALIARALDAGGHDNISVGVFGLEQDGDTPPPQRPERPTRKVEAASLAAEPP
ncbi:serine/threonine-protein phosphatase [Dankookia rubra]|uniref:Serine/threonine-protein phosphatase n=1 Tax=Dankookia rubra TaxID=1442381 RepID=A0A4R5QGF5_9PROT|nr:PP2C family serine/threonine-protein phosphatase [Dankookia rubra]TDH62156.1 serine/threonine-protein phosphatase [Dankookia rubra]